MKEIERSIPSNARERSAASPCPVFISCGQTKDSNELDTAEKIRGRLQKMGFDPYIAVEGQSVRGLKENIFRQLETSEYFVFVDLEGHEYFVGTHESSLWRA
jgi:hypothetical protein